MNDTAAERIARMNRLLDEADSDESTALLTSILIPTISNLVKYIKDGEPKAIRAGTGMVLNALAAVLTQRDETEAARHVKQAAKALKSLGSM